MAEIRVLPEEVRNRIAAGEVLERPASAVKELVENALDAGARDIRVEIVDGGRSLLRVSDDGAGIPPDEMRTAVLNHATSKIRDVDDIYRVASLGFRGEALPSIAAVSRLELASRCPGSDEGRRLEIEGGRVEAEEPAARAPGTVVAVRDLFFNVPARRKFLKSPRAETAAVSEMVTRLALGHPEVAFRLHSSGRPLVEVPQHRDALARIGALFGAEVAEALVPVEYRESEAFALSGFVGRPPMARPNARLVHLLINRRWVRHRPLVQVLRQACEGLLPARQYPVAFLFLAVDPAQVDLNVHPAKLEVRFAEERRLLGGARRAVEMALRGAEPPSEPAGPVAGSPPPAAERADAPAAAEPGSAYAASGGALAGPSAAAGKTAPPAPASPGGGQRSASSAPPSPGAGRGETGTGRAGPSAGAGPAQEEGGRLRGVEAPLSGRYRVLGQAHESYLLVQCAEGILIVDQHAAHERFLYEELRRSAQTGDAQRLLVPAVVELNADEWALLDEVGEELRAMGFRVEPFGERTVSIQAVPAVLRSVRAGALLQEALGDLAGGGEQGRRERLCRSLACRAAVKAGQHLAPEELSGLLERLEREAVPWTCPHGRPFSMLLSLEELARRFQRR